MDILIKIMSQYEISDLKPNWPYDLRKWDQKSQQR